MNVERAWAIGAAIVVGVAVVVGLLVLGSPGEERSRLLDARRVEDLQALTFAVRRHHEREGVLPERIEDMLAGIDPGNATWLRDPTSGEAYGYRRLEDGHFELCATFERRAEPPDRPARWDGEPFRHHDAGPQCFRMAASE